MRRLTRVLIVDDQPANLALVRKVLEPAGFEVSEARSGAEALARAQETGPDLIILDIHLSDMHGLDVLRRLRETAWGKKLRVVAMSALATPEDRATWLQAGCVGSIEKPIAVKTFAQEISRWLPGAEPNQPERPDLEERKRDKLGEILVANLLITPEQLDRALQAQAKSGKRLGQILVEQGALSEDDLAWALSHHLGYPYVFLTPEIIDMDAVRLVPLEILRERRVLPILKFGEEMTLAMADPTDQRTVDEVVNLTGLQVRRALALASNIDEMKARILSGRHEAPGRTTTLTPAAAAEAQYLQFHITQALQQGASEIHLDPASNGQARVRYRLQGVLVDRPAQPAELHAAILRHLRDLTGAGDTPVETAARTQTVGGADILLVATFLPTTSGQAATLGLYPRRTEVPDLVSLGVSDESLGPLRNALEAASGVVMVGCGDRGLRSTLLHALIPPTAGGKIWALETLPIYRRPTLNQTALGSPTEAAPTIRRVVDAGADFVVVDDLSHGEALRAACEAGRTCMILAGHPQGDVIGALSEALDAAGPALVASTLRGILAARAVRLLCPVCKQSVGEAAGRRTFIPVGCEACGLTGFAGRRLLVDVWIMDADIRMLLRSGRSGEAFERILAVGSAMGEQGMALVEHGLISSEELARWR